MDFFEHQDIARKKTRVLVVYFILAILGIVGSIYLVVTGGLIYLGSDEYGRKAAVTFWQPDVLIGTAIVVPVLILMASGFKTMQLSAGGPAVAREVGGRRVDPQTQDFEERRLLNIVEEMAIASGLPAPQVYVLDDEKSINAFAAGRTPSDAVIGVTRGCLKRLNREELQGVIAHEFSHILNGDMRLNLRLMGLLFGILFIAIMGRLILRVAVHSGGGSNRKGGGVLAFLLFGLAVMIIGYVGLFFGKLIKAAVSRQREFLADASAVQFTRNPTGIANALKRIGGVSFGSRIIHPRAEEMSHMFFGNADRYAAMALKSLATHPPLEERIRRLEPSWNGKFPKGDTPDISSNWEDAEDRMISKEKRKAKADARIAGLAAAAAVTAGPEASGGSREKVLASLGNPTPEHLAYGRELYEKMPEDWKRATENEGGAQALVFALLLGQDDALRKEELAMIGQTTDPATHAKTVELHQSIGETHSSMKLALVDLAIPTLRRLDPEEYDRFRTITWRLMESDKQINLFEFALQKVVRRHLDIAFRRAPEARIHYTRLQDLAHETNVLLSTLAFVGTRDREAALAAYELGAGDIEVTSGLQLEPLPAEACSLKDIDEALNKFDQATPLVQKRLLYACGQIVMADNEVTSDEAELLRAIADTIGCPIPPFVKAVA